MKRICYLLLVHLIFFLSLFPAHGETLSLGAAVIDINGTTNLDVMYSDGLFPCAGVNAKVVLPEGVTATGVSKGSLLAETFQLHYNLDVPSEPTVVVYSETETFQTPGVLFTLHLRAQNAAGGNHEVSFAGNSSVTLINSGHGLSSEDGADSIDHTISSGVLTVVDADSDGDGLIDTWENQYFGHLNRDGTGDYDGDGLSDADEQNHGTNPADTDSDGDGMPDGWEVAHGFEPLDSSDSYGDEDGDSYTNGQEAVAESDPHNEYSVPSVEDFETGQLDDSRWAATGSALWDVESNSGVNPDGASTYLAQAPALSNGQDASLTLVMACEDGIVSFGRSVNSEAGADYLHFYVDDALIDSWSGMENYARVSYTITEGLHAFRWEYVKNASGSSGSDTAWIDDIHFPESLDSDFDFMPDKYETLTGLNPLSHDGTRDYDGDGFCNTIEYLEGTVAYSEASYPVIPSVAETFETGDINQSLIAWSTTGDGSWVATSGSAYSGTWAAQSPVIGHGQSASLSTMVFCDTGTIQFGLMTSTEENHDFLEFYVDDVLVDSWSGQSGFILSDNYPITTGIHTLRWTYAKDASGAGGLDLCRVDHIEFAGFLDSDTDGMPDSWEIQNAMNPMIDDSESDTDKNGIRNIDEFDAALEPPDATPPGPVGFSSNPTATGSDTITMRAITAIDPEGNGVQYMFEETSVGPGATDSDWQASPVYTDTGLDADTIYTYRVKVRDLSSNLNESDWSTTRSAMTDIAADTVAPTPNPAVIASVVVNGRNSITITAATASDPSGVQYMFEETSGGPGATDSDWQASPVYTDTGLDPDTIYTYRVRVRDLSSNLNESDWSATRSAVTEGGGDTMPPSPNPAGIGSITADGRRAVTMTAITASDPSGVEYYFEELSGNRGASDSGWQSSPTYTDTRLRANTTYTYRVKYRDRSSDQNETEWSDSVTVTTDSWF